jgi:transcriptional regulator with XRE-family HTH domain
MIKPVVKKFGKRVRQLRLERGLTQEALGSKCDLDLTYIGRIERGEQNSSLVVIGAIAKGLGVSLEELFKGL